ncbi:sigma-54-dependent Fis family transcriptional regulator, partial [bacterium]|nr:sigma-54-dependent Fis family transcriptional regulator [bacterium]
MASEHILVVDDEELVRWTLNETLSDEGYTVDVAETGEIALEKFNKKKFDLVILDIKLPGIQGDKVLEKIRDIDREALVLMITAHGGIESAVQCMKNGAFHYLQKPFEIDEVKLLVKQALELASLRIRIEDHVEKQKVEFSFEGIVGKSPAMMKVFDIARKVADRPTSTLLILGESGTGKGMLVRAIHFNSPISSQPFIEINCAAIPETLLESELFGYEPGAFTDARKRKIGLVEKAHLGTLFLDEIGDMSLPLQAKLLKVIEEKRFNRLGGEDPITIESRFIAASNQDLENMVRETRFREDLLFRLNVITITLPPLRDRDDDVILLAKHFISLLNQEIGRNIESINPDAAAALRTYHWPGNIRELRNVIERVMILEEGPTIELENLPPNIQGKIQPGDGSEGPLTLEGLEKDYILRTLDANDGNIS